MKLLGSYRKFIRPRFSTLHEESSHNHSLSNGSREPATPANRSQTGSSNNDSGGISGMLKAISEKAGEALLGGADAKDAEVEYEGMVFDTAGLAS